MLSTSSPFKFRYYHLPVCWSSPSPPSSAIPLSSLPLCWSSSISFTCVLEPIGSTLLLSIPSKFHLSWYKNGKKTKSTPSKKDDRQDLYVCWSSPIPLKSSTSLYAFIKSLCFPRDKINMKSQKNEDSVLQYTQDMNMQIQAPALDQIYFLFVMN